MTSEFLYTPKSIGSFCHCPTLLNTHSGDFLAAWYGYPDEEYREAKIILTKKKQCHSTWKWTSPEIIFPNSTYSAGNPLLFQEPTGRVCLFFVYLKGTYWNDAELHAAYSVNNGETWTDPISLTLPRGTMVRSAPIQVNGGELLLPAYDEQGHHSILLASREPYRSWNIIHRFEDVPLIQPTIVPGLDNCLTMYFRPTQEPKRIWRSVSPDGGKSWLAPIRTPLPNPLSGIAAVNTNTQTVLVYNHTELHRRYPLSLAITKDHGVSWSNPWHFETAEHEVSYPSFVMDTQEMMHGLYTFNRRMIKYVTVTKEELEEIQ